MPYKGKEKTLLEKGEERNLLPVKRERDSYRGEKDPFFGSAQDKLIG